MLLAYENIEASRVIYTKYLQEQKNLSQDQQVFFFGKLATVHLRLGDIEMNKECFAEAIKEYKLSEEILKKIEDEKRSRKLAELYYLIGNCYLYEIKENHLEWGLENYKKGVAIMEFLLDEISNKKDTKKE